MKLKIPDKLYKYQSYNIQTISNLRKRLLWFSKPKRFNDPFDCTINYDINKIEKTTWKLIFDSMKIPQGSNKAGENKNMFDKYQNDDEPSDEFIGQYAPIFRKVIDDQKEKQILEDGIACLTEVVDNILMWSHYSDGHRGFCLEFSTDYLPFYMAAPVKYSNDLSTLSSQSAEDEILFELATTKAVDWKYEKEWRIFVDLGETGAIYDPNALTGIYFGYEMPIEYREVIAMILQGSSTKLYVMTKSLTKFELGTLEVKFVPEKYMPEKDDDYKAERMKAKSEFSDGTVHVLHAMPIDKKKPPM